MPRALFFQEDDVKIASKAVYQVLYYIAVAGAATIFPRVDGVWWNGGCIMLLPLVIIIFSAYFFLLPIVAIQHNSLESRLMNEKMDKCCCLKNILNNHATPTGKAPWELKVC